MEIKTIVSRLSGELMGQLAKAADAKELAKIAGDQQQPLTEAEAQAVYDELQRRKEALLDDELLGVNGGGVEEVKERQPPSLKEEYVKRCINDEVLRIKREWNQ